MTIQPQSFLASLIHSAVWKTASKGASLVKHVVIAAAIGLSTQLDVFYMALAIFGLLIDIWGMTLTVLAVPYLVKLDVGRFRSQATAIIGFTMLASLAIAAVFFVFREPLSYFAIGFDHSGRQALAEAFVWLAPFIVLHVPTSAIGAALRSRRIFSPVYQSSALNGVVILACIVIAPSNPLVLFWSLSCGTIASFLYVGIFYLFNFGGWRRITGGVISEAMLVFKEAPRLLVLNGTYTIFIVMDRIFASFIPGEGAISALAYALVIAGILPALLSVEGAFITVAAEKSTRSQRSDTTNDLISLVIFLSVGATAFMAVTGYDIIELLLERGAFGSTDTEAVGTALVAFAFMTAPIFLLPPLDQIFQIEKRIGFMVRRTLLGIAVGAILNYVAIFVLGWGIFGLALATTLSYWLIVATGIYGLVRIGYGIALVRHFRWMAWLGAIVGCTAAIIHVLPDMGSLANTILSFVVLGLSLLAGGVLWPGRERTLLKDAISRFQRWRR